MSGTYTPLRTASAAHPTNYCLLCPKVWSPRAWFSGATQTMSNNAIPLGQFTEGLREEPAWC